MVVKQAVAEAHQLTLETYDQPPVDAGRVYQTSNAAHPIKGILGLASKQIQTVKRPQPPPRKPVGLLQYWSSHTQGLLGAPIDMQKEWISGGSTPAQLEGITQTS
jgi:hypothetical protein